MQQYLHQQLQENANWQAYMHAAVAETIHADSGPSQIDLFNDEDQKFLINGANGQVNLICLCSVLQNIVIVI